MMRGPALAALLVAAVVLAGCSSDEESSPPADTSSGLTTVPPSIVPLTTTTTIDTIPSDQRVMSKAQVITAGPPPVGMVVAGKYEIEALIGQGGMGAVYRAQHTLTHRRVALKWLLADDEAMRMRFVREARAMGALEHPNVVGILDIGEEQHACTTIEHISISVGFCHCLNAFICFRDDRCIQFISFSFDFLLCRFLKFCDAFFQIAQFFNYKLFHFRRQEVFLFFSLRVCRFLLVFAIHLLS